MTRFIGTLLAAALVAGATSPLQADDKDATAILDKAIKALGGEEKLAKAQTFTQAAKGTITFAGNDAEVTSNQSVQGLDHARQEFEGSAGGNSFKGVTVVAGDKGWRRFGDDKSALEGQALANQKRGMYLAIVPITVVPLKGKGFKVQAAGEEKVGDKPAVKIKGTGPDDKDFTLYFDKETGLPLKIVGKVVAPTGDEFLQEITFSDYKEMGGIKKATKITATRDGGKFLNQEITDFKVVDKLDPKTFAEPE
jgi:hypothetical protein